MTQLSWRKSSFCQEGEACVHVATTAPGAAVKVAGSADPGEAHLTVSPTAWSTFLQAVKELSAS
ncbi:DUF397 domain-containing protein [Streptomyces sp. ISL-94]|uniref:DUF397 domain-containing protein n=1 Tax=Streptomyces sp. ISL-94 TaxID=2819190 RepID=UPI001BEC413F|nr:DUF397 domain-containing protein [Streptomyces sp. ISL-94]MBT2482890.1 DUF397 domain-containing protein [Streptomyces sp. ISL-94]